MVWKDSEWFGMAQNKCLKGSEWFQIGSVGFGIIWIGFEWCRMVQNDSEWFTVNV